MTTLSVSSLLKCFQNYQSKIPELADYQSQLEKIIKQERPQSVLSIIKLYDHIYPLVEKILWDTDDFDEMLEIYQSLFREQESLINRFGSHEGYDFILSIPVADRPEHLRGCLESILQLCRLYSYGGTKNGFYSKVSVIIVEDSKEKKHIEKDIKLAEEYTKKGLKVHHYGLKEQYDLMLKIPAGIRQNVSSIIGDPSIEHFYHKGQAATRNLSYLKLLQIKHQKETSHKEGSRLDASDREKVLYFFVDSDQLFQVNLASIDGDRQVYGLNYFYYINRIFSENNIAMLTGKLVGDPPVSPSVMMVKFLDDVIAFLQQLSEQAPQQKCEFHQQSRTKGHDAAYHDMANLFGFEIKNTSYDYCCNIKPSHDHIACLQSFSDRINYFFFGEHLTRKTYFNYNSPLTDITPARTIYPGNYITTFDGLKYIIPFGKLRLRMSGPTAGRLIQSEIKDQFATVNLPMLHSRTLQSDFKDEFRPGVEDNIENIDLADEFERQFFGDLMLFTVVKLFNDGVSIEQYNEQLLIDTFERVESELLELFENQHNNVKLKCDELSILVKIKKHWWNQCEEVTESINQIQQFLKNTQHNFGKQSKVYQQVHSAQHRQRRIETMIKELLNYRHDRDAWDNLLVSFHP
jgi:hypothetical protein